MFDSPFLGPRRNRSHFRSSWGTSYSSYEDSPFSSYEDIRRPAHLITSPPSPLGLRTYTRVTHPSPFLPSTDLPSRVNALNRRGATLSTYLAHLAAVMEPLKSAKVDELSELDVKDIMQEGQGLHEAMQEFGEQFAQVHDMLQELIMEKRDTIRKLQGRKEKGCGKGWKQGD